MATPYLLTLWLLKRGDATNKNKGGENWLHGYPLILEGMAVPNKTEWKKKKKTRSTFLPVDCWGVGLRPVKLDLTHGHLLVQCRWICCVWRDSVTCVSWIIHVLSTQSFEWYDPIYVCMYAYIHTYMHANVHAYTHVCIHVYEFKIWPSMYSSIDAQA